MTDADLVLHKLSQLEVHLDRVRRRRPASVDELRDDVDRLDALAMSLLVVVQEAVDIAFHIASDEGWGAPSSYAKGFDALAEHGVLEPSVARALGDAAKRRNRLAHGYASADVERLWHELPGGISAFEAFASAIARHVRP